MAGHESRCCVPCCEWQLPYFLVILSSIPEFIFNRTYLSFPNQLGIEPYPSYVGRELQHRKAAFSGKLFLRTRMH